MLTPRDLQGAEFRKAWRGYGVDQVDAFLRRVVREYETLYREHQVLVERVEELKARLALYTAAEERIEETLRLARETAESTRRAAEREAESLIRHARTRAAELIATAGQRVQMDAARLEAMEKEEARFRDKLRNLLTQHLDLVEAQEHASSEIARLVASWSEAVGKIQEAAESAAAADAEGGERGINPAPAATL